MSNRILTWGTLLLAIVFVMFIPLRRADSAPQHNRKRTLRCTNTALAALKPLPELDYECEEHDEDSRKSPERRARLQAYLKELESFADASWWAAPVEDLNVCAVIKEARAMTDSERRDYLGNGDTIALYGSGSTRLVVVYDPCIKYSYGTLNAFILHRAAGRVHATQVLDAYFSRADNAADMRWVEHNGERLILIEVGTGGLNPETTYRLYAIDRRTQRAVARKLFKDKGKPTNELAFSDSLDPNKGWSRVRVDRRGRLLPEFLR